MTTPKLLLPEIAGAQDQKHVTHNDALLILDSLVQLAIDNFSWTAPPGSPTKGDTYIIGSPATGDWTGREDDIAIYDGAGWVYRTPAEGWMLWARDNDTMYVFDGSAWTVFSGGGGGGETDPTYNTVGVGGASGDATNPLAVLGPNILVYNNTGGTNMKFSKNATADDVSVTFQTNFATFAQMGLLDAGDDFVLKVGAGFNIALATESDGDITFPNQSSVRTMLQMGGTWTAYTDNRWVSSDYSAFNESKSRGRGGAADPSVDYRDFGDHYLTDGSIVKSLKFAYRFGTTDITSASWKVYFQYNAWDGDADTNGEVTRVEVSGGTLTPAGGVTDGLNRVTLDLSDYECPDDGFLLLMLKPTGTLGSNDYIYVTGFYDVVMKSDP